MEKREADELLHQLEFHLGLAWIYQQPQSEEQRINSSAKTRNSPSDKLTPPSPDVLPELELTIIMAS
ncbi:hypothetical protein [Nostoc sp. UHCC 0302]|uniref:hypothetical protein n=1 Tax=Nostoc sp. UHCC 0302 TaxID=3134896 RepID=UPI00311CD6B9